MQKIFFIASIALAGLFITDSFAANTPANGAPQGTSPAMSRDQASQEISKIHADSQKNLLDQAKQIMKSGPEAIQPPPATDDENANDNTTNNTAPNQSRPAQPARPVAPAPAPTYQRPAPAAPAAPQQSAPAQDASQPYSGFGTGQQNQAAPSDSNSKGSNWNMGY